MFSFRSKILCTFLLMFGFCADAIAKECVLTGKIESIQLGEHYFPTQSGDEEEHVVKFTELSLLVQKSSLKSLLGKSTPCKKYAVGQTINVGLCEEQTLKQGYVIQAETGGWVHGPNCLINVKIIKR